jgi:hypothetical protein
MSFFVGALVGRRILLCGLMAAAFVLALALSSRHDDLRRSHAALEARAGAEPHAAMEMTGKVAPIVAAMNRAPAIETREPVQSEPYNAPDADNGERENETMRDGRDRAAEHGPRSH